MSAPRRLPSPLQNPRLGAAPAGLVAALFATSLVTVLAVQGCDNRAAPADAAADASQAPAAPTQPAADPTPATDPVAGDPGTQVPAPGGTDPQALYAQCKERVEGPQAAGECKTDADCTTGGCSSEICATPAALEGMMSTCEIQPCFAVLDSCGCHDGMCTWTVAAASGGAPPITLPPKDQLQQPPG